MKQKLLKVTQRSLKAAIAAASIWFPKLSSLISNKNIKAPEEYLYTNVLDKLKGGGDAYQSFTAGTKKKLVMAEIVFSPDQWTTGFLEDTQLILQLALDQTFLTLKILIKKGLSMFSRDVSLGEYSKTKRLSGIIKRSMHAFLNFSIHKFFFSLPSLPFEIKSHVISYFYRMFLISFYRP